MSHEEMATDSESSGSPQPDRKRKRIVEPEDELEIDLKLPEPPSKKALRKLKKAKADGTKVTKTAAVTATGKSSEAEDVQAAPAKSEWGIWIGNMLWTTSKDELRDFLTEKGGIAKDSITRLNMPAPPDSGPHWKGPKPTNKGFAHVDFTTEADMLKAIGLSETLLAGRKVLIKNAKSFEGRPDTKAGESTTTTEKAPSKRIFVGNLTFDTTTDDVREHFSQAGEVEHVFLTTFEDSGKCKGYGWVRFTSIEAAEAAVAGFILKAATKGDQDDNDEDNETTKSSTKGGKTRKWFINRLQGRSLRCEFAEDAQTRYKKRYGKEATSRKEIGTEEGVSRRRQEDEKPVKRMDKDDRQALRRQKHEDARLIAPGRALAGAQRASAAIVTAAGKKTRFD